MFPLFQFEQYYHSDEDILPPVQLSPCLSVADTGVSLLEPLVS